MNSKTVESVCRSCVELDRKSGVGVGFGPGRKSVVGLGFNPPFVQSRRLQNAARGPQPVVVVKEPGGRARGCAIMRWRCSGDRSKKRKQKEVSNSSKEDEETPMRQTKI